MWAPVAAARLQDAGAYVGFRILQRWIELSTLWKCVIRGTVY